ncbi:MAG: ubiquitin-like domain-containing protein [Candidatus Nomurabacteria bacterium]|nr:ubiquitin-like domain-containing protein [Candidatus Nomurabacteria bacterium]
MRVRRGGELWFGVGILALFVLAIASRSSFAQAEITGGASAGESLITIFDRGEKRIIRSSAGTVGEALSLAGIDLDSSDSVEPSLAEKIEAGQFYINIYRARPVIISDGGERIKIMSASSSATEIIKDAGLTLSERDIVAFMHSDDVAQNGGSLELSITRAKNIQFSYYGAKLTLQTQARTVNDLFEEQGVELADADSIIFRDDLLSDGDTVEIWRNGTEVVTETETIEFKVEKILDYDRDKGYEEVQELGENGAKTVSYEVEMVNGKEVGRRKINEIVTRQPKSQKVVVGMKSLGPKYASSAEKTNWLKAAGIPEEDWGYVDYIVTKESTWRPDAVNKTSGACGLVQALPCSKLGANWSDPVVALKWQYQYVSDRYGGYRQAYEFWVKHKWY